MQEKIPVVSNEIPSKYMLDLREYTKEQSQEDIYKASYILKSYIEPILYDEWIGILNERNNAYGNHSWTVLGIKFLYGMLFTKYLRYVESRSLDSAVDMIGYCALTLAYYFKYCPDGQTSFNNFIFHAYPESIHSIFERHYDNMWQFGNDIYSLDVLDLVFSLVMSISVEYGNKNPEIGKHF